MIDTIKLQTSFSERPYWTYDSRKIHTLNNNTGVSRIVINPSPENKKAGIYLPRLTYIERPSKDGRTFTLNIEFSIPKLLFGNNFSEVSGQEVGLIASKLADLLKDIYNISLSPSAIMKSIAVRVDYSKNIIFDDHTPITSVIKMIQSSEVSRVYDVQKTDFKNGGAIWHVHTNSLDVAVYDKIADLKQERISDKRSYESDGYVQMQMLERLKNTSYLSVARFEVRLNSLRKIRAELKGLNFQGTPTFSELYCTDISRNILFGHWSKVLSNIPFIHLDNQTPTQLLLNIAKANPKMKAREALATVGLRMLLNENDNRLVRNLMEELFTPSQYRRLMIKSKESLRPYQIRALIRIGNDIKAMRPVNIDKYC